MKKYFACLLILSFQFVVLLAGCGNTNPKVEVRFQHVMEVTDLAFSPDGKYLAAGSKGISQKAGEFWEGRVLVWDVAAQKQVASLNQPGWANSICYSPDGKILAVGCGSANVYSSQQPNYHGFVKKPGEIRLYEVPSWKSISTFHDRDVVATIKISPNGKTLASSSHFGPPYPAGKPIGSVTLWDIDLGKEILKVPGIKSHWPGIAFDPNTGDLALGETPKTGVGDGRIIVCETKGGEIVREFFAVEMALPNFLCFSPDGKALASWTNNGPVILWNYQSGKNITPKELTKEFMRMGVAIAFSPDGRLLAGMEQLAFPQGKNEHAWIKLWDLQNQNLFAQWGWEHRGMLPSAVAFSPNSQSLAVGDMAGNIIVYQVAK